MSINIILSNALSGLNTSQAALNEIANNISNVNTPGYARRVVELSTRTIGGQSAGVEVGEIKRVADAYLQRQVYSAAGDEGRYAELSRVHDNLQAILGRPDSDTALNALIDRALTAGADLVTDPTSSVRRSNFLSELTTAASSISRLADNVQRLRQDADNLIGDKVDRANALIARIAELNPLIARQELAGSSGSGLKDELDQSIAELAGIIDLRVEPQTDGTIHVVTSNGYSLVDAGHVQLSYTPQTSVTAGSIFASIMATRVSSSGTISTAPPQPFDSQISSGAIKGLLDLRDRVLPDFAAGLGELAGTLATTINEVHNANVAVPPPQTLTGRETGLLASDAHNFTGATTFAITDSTGTLVRRVDVDFSANTYSVNGGGTVAFAGTVGGLVAALNSALGVTGSAGFSNGVLSLAASSATNGIAIVEGASSPSSRAGHGFSAFFGLNDVLAGAAPSHYDTGLTASDAHGFTAGDTLELRVLGASGAELGRATMTVAGATIGDLVTQMNTDFGAFATFSLDANGKLAATPVAGPPARLEVVSDSTSRGTTGVSLTELFGIGTAAGAERARDLALVSALAGAPQKLALARPSLSPTDLPGTRILAPGDNRGAAALQALLSSKVSFSAAGSYGSANDTLSAYAGLLLAGIGGEAERAATGLRDATLLGDEVKLKRDEVQGVNLDEELASLIVYQQSYNASARVISAAQELFDALVQLV
ncbi:MAG: flagellar hook-associated protein FlgK [Alphaproteobacteria bacterium]|nr:flagellar hook-associated protein FlgK [Alphaproteobacteria bacterium]